MLYIEPFIEWSDDLQQWICDGADVIHLSGSTRYSTGDTKEAAYEKWISECGYSNANWEQITAYRSEEMARRRYGTHTLRKMRRDFVVALISSERTSNPREARRRILETLAAKHEARYFSKKPPRWKTKDKKPPYLGNRYDTFRTKRNAAMLEEAMGKRPSPKLKGLPERMRADLEERLSQAKEVQNKGAKVVGKNRAIKGGKTARIILAERDALEKFCGKKGRGVAPELARRFEWIKQGPPKKRKDLVKRGYSNELIDAYLAGWKLIGERQIKNILLAHGIGSNQ